MRPTGRVIASVTQRPHPREQGPWRSLRPSSDQEKRRRSTAFQATGQFDRRLTGAGGDRLVGMDTWLSSRKHDVEKQRPERKGPLKLSRETGKE